MGVVVTIHSKQWTYKKYESVKQLKSCMWESQCKNGPSSLFSKTFYYSLDDATVNSFLLELLKWCTKEGFTKDRKVPFLSVNKFGAGSITSTLAALYFALTYMRMSRTRNPFLCSKETSSSPKTYIASERTQHARKTLIWVIHSIKK